MSTIFLVLKTTNSEDGIRRKINKLKRKGLL